MLQEFIHCTTVLLKELKKNKFQALKLEILENIDYERGGLKGKYCLI